MNTPRDPDVTIAAWLDAGPNALPPLTRLVVESSIQVTPQRRPPIIRLPWRIPIMHGTEFGLATAALITVVAVGVGFVFLGRPSPAGMGAPSTATATATASADTSVEPTPSRTAANPYVHPIPSQSVDGQAYRYRLDAVLTGRTIEITLPASWRYEDRMAGANFSRMPTVDRPDDSIEWLAVAVPSSINPDPCGTEANPVWVPAGTSIAAIADALTHLKGFTSSPITDTTVGDHAVKTFTITPASDACRAGATYGIWNGGDARLGMDQRISVIDVNGDPLLVQARLNPSGPRPDIEAIVGSISVGP